MVAVLALIAMIAVGVGYLVSDRFKTGRRRNALALPGKPSIGLTISLGLVVMMVFLADVK